MRIKITQLSLDLRHGDNTSVEYNWKNNEEFTKELDGLFRRYNITVLGENTIDMTEEYSDLKCDEFCSNCENEVYIYANKDNQFCPVCNEKILPCSMCNGCKSDCIFD